nr:hypothetical protein [Tanacetum cinerariifolium]
ESEEEETRQEEDENFDPIPRTPEKSEEERNDEEEQDLRLREQTNQFADAVSAILDIVHQYMDQEMKEAV